MNYKEKVREYAEKSNLSISVYIVQAVESMKEWKERVNSMSEREKAIELLKTVPDNEISYIIGYIQGLTEKNKNYIEEVEPDEWDLKMIAEAKKENDGKTISLEEMLQKDGLTYADLQD